MVRIPSGYFTPSNALTHVLLDTMFHFTCFNVEDPNDHSVGLINGELALPGNLLRREVFDPVVSQVLDLIAKQSKRVTTRIVRDQF
jgi:hypothetical protein